MEWWLEIQYAKSLDQESSERESILMLANEQGYAYLEQPEPLKILYMLRSSGTTYWRGALVNQPYMLLKELNAAAAGEKQHEEKRSLARIFEAINR